MIKKKLSQGQLPIEYWEIVNGFFLIKNQWQNVEDDMMVVTN